MSDLSRLLDDVYGTSGEPASAPRAADWAGFFRSWPPDAGPERGADHLSVVPDPVETLGAIFDLGVAEPGSGVSGLTDPGLAVVQDPAPPAPPPTWTMRDDDILPARSPRGHLRRRRR